MGKHCFFDVLDIEETVFELTAVSDSWVTLCLSHCGNSRRYLEGTMFPNIYGKDKARIERQ